ncbi:family with sequence similarity 124 member A [Phyllostomus discolor]|uniref:Family with sequence similarity 124 member A n=1 Tax=Phyllostomus discolor TaxID=89673 RepID=A0A834DKX9_9CHIR|nr:family with sequence similarity 124 member A [Phyllostomus discolor]
MDRKAGGGGEEEEDDCVDSGAETGGSDYSHMSSTSSELSVEEAQDPFLVSIHIIADPGESRPLQEAIDKVLAWIHPDLQLFRVSERRAARRRRRAPRGTQPALAVLLFLQEDFGEERILRLHRALRRPPWRHHHTERVPGRLLPYLLGSQDFFTLAPGTPLWAVRPVHYGREIVRFTVYCRHDHYADSLKFYELVLRRSPSQRKKDFCIFPIFSNLEVDIQFSLKRLPGDQSPAPTDCAVLEFRVRDLGELVPLLPHPCSPISEGRWQTEDHDGNRILLQAQRAHRKCPTPSGARHPSEQEPACVPSPSSSTLSRPPGGGRGPLPDSPRLGPSQPVLPAPHQQELAGRAGSAPGKSVFQRSKSLFCLPTEDPSPARADVPRSRSGTGVPGHWAPEWRHGHLLSIDDLEGSQETDVDTGLQLSSSDLSVVSAYSAPSRFCGAWETPVPSEGGGSGHCSAEHKGARAGPLPTGSGVTTETPWASLPLFTKGPSHSLATGVAAPPASGAPSLTGSASERPGGVGNTQRTGRDVAPPPALAGPGDSDTEEFYI